MGNIRIFTGHRELPGDTAPLYDALLRHITALYDGGCTDFVSGGAMGFDLLAAEAVLALRPLYPDMRLVKKSYCLCI